MKISTEMFIIICLLGLAVILFLLRKRSGTMREILKIFTMGYTQIVMLSGLSLIMAIILLVIGLSVGPTSADSNIVNQHRLHIKNTLYLFSGTCFIVWSIFCVGKSIIEKNQSDKNSKE